MTGAELGVVAAATILGPILAVQAQKWIERATQRTNARRSLFHSLMSNRATRLNDEYVRALNLIDLEFSQTQSKPRDKAVIDAWRSLFGELHNSPGDGASADENRAWNQRVDDRLISLLAAMSKALGYDFSDEQLRRGIYYPKGRFDLEQTQLAVLRGAKALFEGTALPMKLTEMPNSPELLEAQIAMMKKSAGAYGADGVLRVHVLPGDGTSAT